MSPFSKVEMSPFGFDLDTLTGSSNIEGSDNADWIIDDEYSRNRTCDGDKTGCREAFKTAPGNAAVKVIQEASDSVS